MHTHNVCFYGEIRKIIPALSAIIFLMQAIMYISFCVILSLPLIQEGQLSVSGERMCTILVNRLED